MPHGISHCHVSVYLFIRLSLADIVSKWLNIGSHKQWHMIVQEHQFSDAEDLCENQMGPSPTGAPNAGGVG